MKIPVPRVSIAEVERAFRAFIDRLMRFEIVGNFEGQPIDGQVPAYDEATRTWRPATLVSGGGGVAGTAVLDFGSTPTTDKKFTITDAAITASSRIVASVCWLSSLGRSVDELAVDPISVAVQAKAGGFDVVAMAQTGRVSGKYGLAYTVV